MPAGAISSSTEADSFSRTSERGRISTAITREAIDDHGVGGILDRLADCTAEHFDVRHSTFQGEPESHRDHEDLGEVH